MVREVISLAIVWLIIAVIMLIGEFVCPIFFMFWFSVGALVALVTTFITSNVTVQIVVFLVVSVISAIFIKPLTTKVFKNDARDELNMNGIIGKTAKVIEPIDNINGKGRVKINGEIWTAVNENESEIILTDELVSITKIDGVKLIVRKVTGGAEKNN